MPIIPLTDPADPRLAVYRAVSDPDLATRLGLFVAEGRLVVQRAVSLGHEIVSVVVTPTARHALVDTFAALPGAVPVFECDLPVVEAITGFHLHRGCIALVRRPPSRKPLEVITGSGPMLVLEGIGNADNVGAIFRNAAAFGAAGVWLGPGCCDPLYRKAVRTSMGTVLGTPFARVPDWPDGLDELGRHGLVVAALTTSSDAVPLEQFVAGTRVRVAFALGTEGDGLSAEVLRRAAVHVRIRMAPGIDSLNVAVAAAIALHAVSERDAGTGAAVARLPVSQAD